MAQSGFKKEEIEMAKAETSVFRLRRNSSRVRFRTQKSFLW
jgi:hypothetical protein